MFVDSKHSVAGHKGTLTGPGIFAKKSTSTELEFYTKLSQLCISSIPHNLGDLLTDWTPKCYGVLNEGKSHLSQGIPEQMQFLPSSTKFSNFPEIPTDKTDQNNDYIVLSNLYDHFLNPSILDVKLGALLTDNTALEQKVERLRAVSESTTSGSLHARICGMKLYCPQGKLPDLSRFDSPQLQITWSIDHGDHYLQFDKFFGRNLTVKTFKHAFYLYIFNGVTKEVGIHYLHQFHMRLQLLYNCLLNYEVRIISSSLLFILENSRVRTEGDYQAMDPLVLDDLEDEEDDEDDEDIIKQLSSLHMIDFAHARFTPGEGPDENILVGVENLIDIFQQLIDEHDL